MTRLQAAVSFISIGHLHDKAFSFHHAEALGLLLEYFPWAQKRKKLKGAKFALNTSHFHITFYDFFFIRFTSGGHKGFAL